MNWSIALIAAFPIVLLAQSPTAFEVATIKPNVSGSNMSKWDPDHHGNFKAENASLKNLISFAYQIPKLLISGPTWMDSPRFDVNAKGGSEASDEQVKVMTRTLLEERFRLRVHRETKEMAVYLLEAANGGLKALAVDSSKPAPRPRIPAGAWSYLYMTGTLTALTAELTNLTDRPVVDRSGIPGTYYFELWFNNRLDSEGPDMFSALRQELGLRLTSSRACVETLVVDSAEKIPIEN